MRILAVGEMMLSQTLGYDKLACDFFWLDVLCVISVRTEGGENVGSISGKLYKMWIFVTLICMVAVKCCWATPGECLLFMKNLKIYTPTACIHVDIHKIVKILPKKIMCF